MSFSVRLCLGAHVVLEHFIVAHGRSGIDSLLLFWGTSIARNFAEPSCDCGVRRYRREPADHLLSKCSVANEVGHPTVLATRTTYLLSRCRLRRDMVVHSREEPGHRTTAITNSPREQTVALLYSVVRRIRTRRLRSFRRVECQMTYRVDVRGS